MYTCYSLSLRFKSQLQNWPEGLQFSLSYSALFEGDQEKKSSHCTTAVMQNHQGNKQGNKQQWCNSKRASEQGDKTQKGNWWDTASQKERKTAEIWVSVSAARGWNTAERKREAVCSALAHITQWEVQKLSVKEALKRAFTQKGSSLNRVSDKLREGEFGLDKHEDENPKSEVEEKTQRK